MDLHLLLLFCLLLFCYGAAKIAPVRKIAIIGAGPAGLSLAASLQQLNSGCQEICIYESRESAVQAKMGGGVQLSGGAAVLERLGLLDELEKIAQPVQQILARNAQGKQLLLVDVADVLKKSPTLLSADGGRPLFFSVMRDGLQKLLYDVACRPSQPAKVSVKTKQAIRAIEEDARTGCVSLVLADGKREEGFDMVFGGDGTNSVARDYIRGGVKSQQDLRYTGIKIVYGVTGRDEAFDLRPAGQGTFWQWFGDSSYVLSASYGGTAGSIQHMMALVYRDDEGGASITSSASAENAEWKSESKKASSKKEKLRAFLSRAGFTNSSGIFTLLDSCQEDRFIELAVNDRSAPLLKWASSSGRVVLLGDACHAMAPFLGQGANQALQDSYVLATSVKRLNALASLTDNGKDWLQRAAWNACPLSPFQLEALNYQRIRLPPTAIISLKSNFLGLVETLGGSLGCFARDNFFRFTGALGIARFVLVSGALPKID